MDKRIQEIALTIADHLGIDSLPIKFEDLGEDDSRLYIKEEYVAINIIYENDFIECAKSIAHEYRHVFQLFYCNIMNDEIAKKWKSLLPTIINSSNMKGKTIDYVSQELEIDAFAFTKFYLENYEGIEVINKIDGFDKIIDYYISNRKFIM